MTFDEWHEIVQSAKVTISQHNQGPSGPMEFANLTIDLINKGVVIYPVVMEKPIPQPFCAMFKVNTPEQTQVLHYIVPATNVMT